MSEAESNADEHKVNGGLGERSERTESGLTEIKDERIVQRAIREGWHIPAEYREALIKRQVKIAVDPTVKPRYATSAFKALIMADRLNQVDRLAAIQSAMDPERPEAIASTPADDAAAMDSTVPICEAEAG